MNKIRKGDKVKVVRCLMKAHTGMIGDVLEIGNHIYVDVHGNGELALSCAAIKVKKVKSVGRPRKTMFPGEDLIGTVKPSKELILLRYKAGEITLKQALKQL